jgi:hypothetical protein
MSIKSLRARIAELEQNAEEQSLVLGRLAKILTDTTNAFHDGPLENGLWSWHDLAERARLHRAALGGCLYAFRKLEQDENAKGPLRDLCWKMSFMIERVLYEPNDRRREISGSREISEWQHSPTSSPRKKFTR